MKNILFIVAILISSITANAQCNAGQKKVFVSLKTDGYASESSWNIIQNGSIIKKSQGILENQTQYLDSVCVDTSSCLIFNFYDQYGDGLCYQGVNGRYALIIDNDTVTQGSCFNAHSKQFTMNCPTTIGLTCSQPLLVDTGYHTNKLSGLYYWTSFTPAETGNYRVTTCGLNSCNTQIAMYDTCFSSLNTKTDLAGSLHYNDDFCGYQSQINLVLQAGKSYLIKLADVDGMGMDCDSVKWHLSYLGPNIGCMNPTACNYDPLATVSNNSCIYYPSPLCAAPDLQVDAQQLKATIQIGTLTNDQTDPNSACYIQENCIGGYGQRQIIEFSTKIHNIGNKDYFLGYPPANPSLANQTWKWDVCHEHWHYDGYAAYLLYDENNNEIPIGFKNGFCVLDLGCTTGTGKYSCGNQGISVGCYDEYYVGLTCQWVDITSVPDGKYQLVVKTNWHYAPDALGSIESNFTNNYASACLQITRDPMTNAPAVELLENCAPYVDCAGDTFGNAKPDCQGICNGTTLKGNRNIDSLRNIEDVQVYLNNCIADSTTATLCNDLNNDGKIAVTDAALLQNCIYKSTTSNIAQQYITACEFKGHLVNPFETVTVSLEAPNTLIDAIDISIKNPSSAVTGIELELAGLNIVYAEALGGLQGQLKYNATGKLVWIGSMDATNDGVIDINPNSIPRLRVYYNQIYANQACIDTIIAINNMRIEEVKTAIGIGCRTILTATILAEAEKIDLRLSPNPFNQNTTLSFKNPTQQPCNLHIIDPTGRLVRTYKAITTDKITIDKNELSPGFYTYQLQHPKGDFIGKMIIE